MAAALEYYADDPETVLLNVRLAYEKWEYTQARRRADEAQALAREAWTEAWEAQR